MIQRPGQRLVDRGVFGVQPPGGRQFPGAGLHAGGGLLRHCLRVTGQRGFGVGPFMTVGEAVQAESAEGFQHEVAGRAVRTGARRGEQRAVDQVQYRRLGVTPGDCGRRFQGERAGKNGKPRKARLPVR